LKATTTDTRLALRVYDPYGLRARPADRPVERPRPPLTEAEEAFLDVVRATGLGLMDVTEALGRQCRVVHDNLEIVLVPRDDTLPRRRPR
jgi:hypothetical protein